MEKEEMMQVPQAYQGYVNLVKNYELPEALNYTARLESFIAAEVFEMLAHESYGPDKWTVMDVLQHIIDTERVFAFRALWFARTPEGVLPGFDQDIFVRAAKNTNRSVRNLLDEFSETRKSSISLFSSFSTNMLLARGMASGNPLQVQVIGYIMAGHVLHHISILRERYLPLLREKGVLSVVDYQPEWKKYFETLNKVWIERYFELEHVDQFVLEHPQEAVLAQGGAIYFVRLGTKIIGTAALKKVDDHTFEFTKMAVDERYQGLGAGVLLCNTGIDKAKELKAKKLILYTNDKLQTAVRMYRKLGFTDIPVEPGVYGRANVKMEMDLERQ